MSNKIFQPEYPFVGRDDALRAFDEVLQDPQRKQRVVFYQGEAGIGKTWLLQEIIRQYHDRVGLVVAPKIIDMTVTRIHRISGVREEIIDLLGKKHFAEYQAKQERFLAERDKPEADRAAPSDLRGLREAADEQFKKDCEKAYPGRTVVLLFDTFEKVQREDAGHYIFYELAQRLSNFVFVIASRDQCPIKELVRTMELKGLTPKEAQAFFASRRQPISDETAAALWKVFDGHPLWLDMTLLWLSVGALSVDELIELPTDEKPCSPLERALLEPLKTLGLVPGVIPETVTGEERARQHAAAFQIILLMAYFNRRFNRQFLEETYTPVPVLASLDNAINVLSRLLACFFVKQRPDGDLQLHDAMQDLILKCMKDMLTALTGGPSWTDAEKTLARRAVEVYDALIEETDKEASRTVDREKREDLERKVQELRAERLGYVLRVDLNQGYEYFIEHFDRNLIKREFGLCELFMAEILPYEHLYNPRRFEIQNRRFQLALARGDFDRAKVLAETAEQRALLLFGLHSDAYTKEPAEAKQHLLDALEICQKNALSLNPRWWLVNTPEGLLEACREEPSPLSSLALAQQRLGFTCRTLGQMDETAQWYERCRETAEHMGKQGAWLYTEVLNSLGYVYGIMGRYQEAQSLIRNALNMRQRFGWQAEIGYCYSTLGEIARFEGEYWAADASYNRALEIFQRLRNHEWQAIVLHEAGENARLNAWKYRSLREEGLAEQWFEQAEKALQESQRLYEEWNLSRDQSTMLRRLGRVLRDRGRLNEGEALLQQGYQIAQEADEFREQLECLTDLATVCIRQGDYEGAEAYIDQVKEFQLRDRVYHYPVIEGTMHLLRGDLLYAKHCWEEALEETCIGLVQLGHFGGYAHARLRSRLDNLRSQLDGLPYTKTKRSWCRRLVEVWEKEELDKERPELTLLCKGYEKSLIFLSKKSK